MHKLFDFITRHWVQTISVLLMIVGFLFAFFFRHFGGALVGFAFGLCFAKEIESYIIALRDYYTAEGLFKTLMITGTALYLLIALPAFLIAIGAGFAAIAVLNWGERGN